MYKGKSVEIQTVIDAIEKQIQDTECVFRGEPECYEEVSCGAFREFNNVKDKLTLPSQMPTNIPGLIVDTSGFEIPFTFTTSKEDIQKQQEKMLRDLQNRIGEEGKVDPLSMTAILQHIGHGTHLLDFTKDYRIAMFFACRKEFDEDGRIILLQTNNEKYKFHDMSQKKELHIAEGRAEAQKSVLVDCPEFFVEETDHYYVCRIPKNLKVPFMEYLKEKGISEETMFPDYLGLIKKEENRKQSHKNFREGLEFENRKKYDEAIQCYSKAINLKYDFAGAYKHRGYVWHMKNELDKSEEDLTKSLYFDPTDMNTPFTVNEALALTEPGFAHFHRSIVYAKKGETDKALSDCSKGINLAPNSASQYFNRGLIYAEKGELDNAINDLSKGLEIKPDDSKGLGLRGKLHWQKGNIEKAMDDFSKAIEMNTDDPEVLKLRGVGNARKGELNRAIDDFSKAIELKPRCAETLKYLGKAYAEIDKLDDAMKNLSQSIAINADDPEALHYRGIGHAIKGRLDNALDDFNKALKIKSDNPEILKNRAKLYCQNDRFDEAITDLNRVMKLRSDDSEVLRLLTIIHEKRSEQNED